MCGSRSSKSPRQVQTLFTLERIGTVPQREPSFRLVLTVTYPDAFEAHYGFVALNGQLVVREYHLEGTSFRFQADIEIDSGSEDTGDSNSSARGCIYNDGPIPFHSEQ